MTRIEFFHQKDLSPEGTIALRVPTKEFLQSMLLNHISEINLSVGLALKSPKDDFSKYIGREISVHNLKEQTFSFENVSCMDGKYFYSFCTNISHSDRSFIVTVVLTTVNNCDFVRFINGEIL